MAVTTIVLFISLLLVCPNTTNGAEDHQVGKRDVAPHCGVFGPDQNQQQRVQLVGKRGQKGEPWVIDYGEINKKIEKRLESREFDEKIQSIIDKKLDEAMRKINKTLNAKLLQLETTFTNSFEKPREEINSSALDENCSVTRNGFRYNGFCFWLVMKRVSFHEGRTLCRERRGDVAGILSSEHYALVTSYIRSMIPESRSVSKIWLGMAINPQTRVVSLLDGESSPYVSWFPGQPMTASGYTHIYILAKKVASDKHQGMTNHLPSSRYHGVLCKI